MTISFAHAYTDPRTVPLLQANRCRPYCKIEVRDAVTEVDSECCEGCTPVVCVAPFLLGSGGCQVEQLAGGVLAREAAPGLDDFADLAVERLDRIGDRYERRRDATASPDRVVAAVERFGLGE
jgi:hypothetical protein